MPLVLALDTRVGFFLVKGMVIEQQKKIVYEKSLNIA